MAFSNPFPQAGNPPAMSSSIPLPPPAAATRARDAVVAELRIELGNRINEIIAYLEEVRGGMNEQDGRVRALNTSILQLQNVARGMVNIEGYTAVIEYFMGNLQRIERALGDKVSTTVLEDMRARLIKGINRIKRGSLRRDQEIGDRLEKALGDKVSTTVLEDMRARLIKGINRIKRGSLRRDQEIGDRLDVLGQGQIANFQATLRAVARLDNLEPEIRQAVRVAFERLNAIDERLNAIDDLQPQILDDVREAFERLNTLDNLQPQIRDDVREALDRLNNLENMRVPDIERDVRNAVARLDNLEPGIRQRLVDLNRLIVETKEDLETNLENLETNLAGLNDPVQIAVPLLLRRLDTLENATVPQIRQTIADLRMFQQNLNLDNQIDTRITAITEELNAIMDEKFAGAIRSLEQKMNENSESIREETNKLSGEIRKLQEQNQNGLSEKEVQSRLKIMQEKLFLLLSESENALAMSQNELREYINNVNFNQKSADKDLKRTVERLNQTAGKQYEEHMESLLNVIGRMSDVELEGDGHANMLEDHRMKLQTQTAQLETQKKKLENAIKSLKILEKTDTTKFFEAVQLYREEAIEIANESKTIAQKYNLLDNYAQKLRADHDKLREDHDKLREDHNTLDDTLATRIKELLKSIKKIEEDVVSKYEILRTELWGTIKDLQDKSLNLHKRLLNLEGTKTADLPDKIEMYQQQAAEFRDEAIRLQGRVQLLTANHDALKIGTDTISNTFEGIRTDLGDLKQIIPRQAEVERQFELFTAEVRQVLAVVQAVAERNAYFYEDQDLQSAIRRLNEIDKFMRNRLDESIKAVEERYNNLQNDLAMQLSDQNKNFKEEVQNKLVALEKTLARHDREKLNQNDLTTLQEQIKNLTTVLDLKMDEDKLATWLSNWDKKRISDVKKFDEIMKENDANVQKFNQALRDIQELIEEIQNRVGEIEKKQPTFSLQMRGPVPPVPFTPTRERVSESTRAQKRPAPAETPSSRPAPAETPSSRPAPAETPSSGPAPAETLPPVPHPLRPLPPVPHPLRPLPRK